MTRCCLQSALHPHATKFYPGLRLTVVLACCLARPAAGQDFVPFAIPARVAPGQGIWMADQPSIMTGGERLAVGGHFRRDGQDVRIWGVNLCFGANFPSHADAAVVAARLAAAGVNSVRCHHMDTSRWPRGIWNARDGRTIEPQALDRLDFFINELARRGICVNLNLHVGRAHSEYLGLPRPNTDYDKIVGIFTPALIEAQKQYAGDLLTHRNPYRSGVRYADDPAVAFVEITNEDSFFMWNGDEKLRTLPAYYADLLRGQFNVWLQQRYASEDVLRTAWSQGTQPLGDNLLGNSTFTDWDAKRGMPRSWNVEQHEGCRASVTRSRTLPSDALQVEIGKADSTDWHLQFNQGGFALVEGQYYTVSFRASSVQPRSIACGVGQAHDPWTNLGLSRRVDLGPDWKTFHLGFVATAADSNARVSFSFGGNTTTFSLAQVELRPGGQTGLAADESVRTGSVSLFRENESTPRILDRVVFLAETEKAYFDGMRTYVKKDLGCGALVTGTIVFGPLGLYAQSDMDYIDSHAYWQHPTFPGRPWDPANWLIQQKPMTDHPDEATLFRIAAERLAGKPFTLSEYNHPAPLDSQAECVPMVASFAAAQDWDGVWLFDYASGTDWARQAMSGFFDMAMNPAKWGFMRAGAAIFRDRCIQPLPGPRFLDLGGGQTEGKDLLRHLAQDYLTHNSNMLAVTGMQRETLLKSQQVAGFRPPASQADNSASDTKIDWTVKDDAGLYAVQDSGGSVYVGHAPRFAEATDRKITIDQPSFVALMMTGLDGKNGVAPAIPRQILLTACGRCENTGMQFSPDRRTVGRNWGHAPVQIEAVRGRVILPEGQWTCHALAPDGSPKQEVPITYENGRGTLILSPEYGTMWYLLQR